MSVINIPITIGDTCIRQDRANRYCLNDLYTAAKKPTGKAPEDWTKKNETKRLLEQLFTGSISQSLSSFEPSIVVEEDNYFAYASFTVLYVLFLGQEFSRAFIEAL